MRTRAASGVGGWRRGGRSCECSESVAASRISSGLQIRQLPAAKGLWGVDLSLGLISSGLTELAEVFGLWAQSQQLLVGAYLLGSPADSIGELPVPKEVCPLLTQLTAWVGLCGDESPLVLIFGERTELPEGSGPRAQLLELLVSDSFLQSRAESIGGVPELEETCADSSLLERLPPLR